MTKRTDLSNLASGGAASRGSGALRSRAIAATALLALTLAAGFAANSGARSGAGLPGSGADDLAFDSGATGGVHFSGRLDRGSVLQGGDGAVRMELVLAADDAPSFAPHRVPTDLVVVLDRSGSMSGKPLADAVASVRRLVERLGDGDRFALVSYASDARMDVPLGGASDANRTRWLAEVGRIGAGGGTNMSAGIDLATRTIARTRQSGRLPRVILLSDGYANEGDSSREGLRARAARAVAGEYVLSTVGVGVDFDEALMTSLADAGTGNYYYVRDGSDLGDVFAGEFDSARETVAQAVTVEIDLGPGVALHDAAGYPIERDGSVARFRPGALFAGQSRHVWLSFAAPTAARRDVELGAFRMTWRTPGSNDLREARLDRRPVVACVEGEDEYVASLNPDVVVRSLGEDAVAKLKQDVAARMAEGRFEDAKDEIAAFKRSNQVMYRALGLVQEEMPSYEAASELEADVARSRVASPAAVNELSKKLAADGQDGRRQGAKR